MDESPERERQDEERGPNWPEGADPGSFIGREPERAVETIPGGVGPGDERVAAHSTQSTGVGRPDVRGQPSDEPTGHRDGDDASDAQLREAGQDR